ncbi:hypothetical protein [Peribacillus asahii]|uniref:hypothetical protein n=1 Tax=Peribacillus asahii TaxID=228899 RepID=UPI00207A4496|nr:hypothetical protein [Peribacillus asahii]USK69196.1 hypothetical protein LIS76_16730 [Peribacillus asahii]
MTIVEQAMQNEELRKAILIEFGFGEVKPKKVEKWLKEQYPVQFAELKRNTKKSNVLQFSTELTTAEERTAFLDRVMKVIDSK